MSLRSVLYIWAPPPLVEGEKEKKFLDWVGRNGGLINNSV